MVIDPYTTETEKRADLHLWLKSGTDGALACAVMHVLLYEGPADWKYLSKYSDNPQRLEEYLRERTPAWATPMTGRTVS